MKEAGLDECIDIIREYGCTIGKQKCEEITKIWIRYLCKVAATIYGC